MLLLFKSECDFFCFIQAPLLPRKRVLLHLDKYRKGKEKYHCCLTHTCDNLNLPHTWDYLENSASFMGCWENSALLDPPHPTWSMTRFPGIQIGDRQRRYARAIRDLKIKT